MVEFSDLGIPAKNQVPVDASYKGHDLGLGFRADIVVDQSLLLELKVAESIHDTHLAQTIAYLKLMGYKRGYILNFGAKLMKEGIKRVSI